MIRPIAIATAILVTSAAAVLAQGGNPPSTGQPAVIGQTGTMYDGNNANLQLPPEPNAYWARLWSGEGSWGNAGAASAVGAGTAGTSLGGAQTGGEH